MSVLMGLYESEPEPGDPTRHEVDQSWYQRQTTELWAIAPVERSYRLDLRADFIVTGGDVGATIVRWLALLTPGGQLIWARRVPEEIVIVQAAVYTVTYSLDVQVESAALVLGETA